MILQISNLLALSLSIAWLSTDPDWEPLILTTTFSISLIYQIYQMHQEIDSLNLHTKRLEGDYKRNIKKTIEENEFNDKYINFQYSIRDNINHIQQVKDTILILMKSNKNISNEEVQRLSNQARIDIFEAYKKSNLQQDMVAV